MPRSIADAYAEKAWAIRLVRRSRLYGFTHQMGAIEVLLKLIGDAARLADRTTGFAHPPRPRRLCSARSAPRFPRCARNSSSCRQNYSRPAHWRQCEAGPRRAARGMARLAVRSKSSAPILNRRIWKPLRAGCRMPDKRNQTIKGVLLKSMR